MTQEEYLSLKEEEQNALFARKVAGRKFNLLGLAWVIKGEPWIAVEDFDPINDLNHAFMGVDKIIEDGDFFLEYWSDNEWLVSQHNVMSRAKGIGKKSTVCHKDRNQAIMLMCLKAKGVVE